MRGNLPAGAMDIVGRTREASEARRRLGDTRLLTLTGIGGVGKTRLALKVAAEVQRVFRDGVWLVDLAPLHEDELLARTVGRTLGLRDQSAGSSVEFLATYLADKRLLLILDNCEHLLDACARLAGRLLNAAPGLRILATSREAMRIPGEAIFDVPPLTLPAIDDWTDEDVEAGDAVALFVERGRDAAPQLVIDARNRAVIAQICRRLDGIPLAIELAAVWIRAMSPVQIYEHLADRFSLLSVGHRGATSRHQTLRAAIDWSFELCSAEERTLWSRLAIFSGNFDLEAAEMVCDRPPIQGKILPLLANLIDKSVLIREGYGRRASYRMLETLRQYGHEYLCQTGGRLEMAGNHLAYYRRRAGVFAHGWFTARQEELFEDCLSSLPNYRNALKNAIGELNDVRAGLEIAKALNGYWIFGGAFGEARYWYERIARRCRPSEDGRGDSPAMAALFALMQGEVTAVAPYVARYQYFAKHDGSGRSQAIADLLKGRILYLSGDYDHAVRLLRASRDWYRDKARSATGDEVPETLLVGFFASFYLAAAAAFADDEHAREFCAACLEMAASAGAAGETSMGMWVSGIERWRAGDVRRAAQFFHDSLRIDHSAGYRYSPAWSIEALAWAAAADDHYDNAARLLGIAQTLRHLIGLSLSGFHGYLNSHRECERRIRDRLGDDRFDRAFAWGADLSACDGIAYAVGTVAKSDQADHSPAEFFGGLTDREREVAKLIAEGMSNRQIAERLSIASRTTEGHVEHILAKLGFRSRAQIAAWVVQATTKGN